MRRSVTVVALTLVALVVAGCAGKSKPASTAPPSPSPAVSTSAASSPSTPTADQTIRITYAGGKVSGVSTVVKVKQNSTVALVVTSDTADEIHLHGYDKHIDVTKGGTATLVFQATLPGRFEVELEKLQRRLVVLQVQ